MLEREEDLVTRRILERKKRGSKKWEEDKERKKLGA